MLLPVRLTPPTVWAWIAVCVGVFICCGLRVVRPRNTDAEAAVCWRDQRRYVEPTTDPPHTHSIATYYNLYSKLSSSEDNHKSPAAIVSEFVWDNCSFRMAAAAVHTWRIINNNDMINLLTAIGLTLGGSRTVHIYTQTVHRTTQWNRIYRIYIPIRFHKHNDTNTKFTKLNRSTQNIQPYTQW